MAKFLALYMGSPESVAKAAAGISDDDRARGMAAWGQWMAQHAAAIVDSGGPLGATMKASAAGIAAVRNHVAGYVIVEAESHDAAARLFVDHPHFTIFPGDCVEVMQCLPVPGA